MNWIEANNGALMVIITFVYAIATILICCFNAKSAKWSQKQLEESQKQHDDDARRSILPVLTVESKEGIINRSIKGNDKISANLVEITFKNIGNGTAQCVHIKSDLNKTGEHNDEEIIRYLAAGEVVPFKIASLYSAESCDESPEELKLILYFKDLLANEYKQIIKLSIAKSNGNFTVKNCDVGEVAIVYRGK